MLVVGVGDVEVCDPPRWSMSLTPLFTSTTGGTSTVIKVQFPEVVLDKAFEVEGGLLRFPGRLPRVLIARQNLFQYGVIVSPGQTTGPPGSTARLVSGGGGAQRRGSEGRVKWRRAFRHSALSPRQSGCDFRRKRASRTGAVSRKESTVT